MILAVLKYLNFRIAFDFSHLNIILDGNYSIIIAHRLIVVFNIILVFSPTIAYNVIQIINLLKD